MYHYQFLVLNFGENFMKIRTKIPKLQMHANLHKNVNENMSSFTFLCIFLRVNERHLNGVSLTQH